MKYFLWFYNNNNTKVNRNIFKKYTTEMQIYHRNNV